jgi:hypothetical protein
MGLLKIWRVLAFVNIPTSPTAQLAHAPRQILKKTGLADLIFVSMQGYME